MSTITQYKTLKDNEIIEKFLSGNYMKRLIKLYGEIDIFQYASIPIAIKSMIDNGCIRKCWYDEVYCLVKYAHPTEIENCISLKTQIKKWGNTLENFISRYGNNIGTTKYTELSKLISARNKGTGYMQMSEYISKKYNITHDEATANILKSRKASHQTRKQRYGEDHYRKISKLSREYYFDKGFIDIENIDNMRAAYVSKILHSKDNYVKLYGTDEGEKKLNRLIQKRKTTILYKIENGKCPNNRVTKGKASKQSMKFFNSLLSALYANDIILDRNDIHLGEIGYKPEWWVRDLVDANVYYFIDFFIPKYKIAIEFDGIDFHCNDIDNWPNKSKLLKNTNQFYYEKEIRKKEAIKNIAELFLTVRSDNINLPQIINDLIEHVRKYNDK